MNHYFLSGGGGGGEGGEVCYHFWGCVDNFLKIAFKTIFSLHFVMITIFYNYFQERIDFF